MYHTKDHFRRVRTQLKMLKALGVKNGPAFDDTLEAITNKSVKHQQHEIDLNSLLNVMGEKNNKIELIQEIVDKNKKLNIKYNHKVDTNAKLLGVEKVERMIE